MTDDTEEMQMGEEALDEEPLANDYDSLSDTAQVAVDSANEMHERMSQWREWSVNTAQDIKSRAALLYELDEISEEERDGLFQQARRVRTIYQRLNNG